ncbi:MAG: hypothetical protein RI904_2922, partial [Pseudomonadota bacterium]
MLLNLKVLTSTLLFLSQFLGFGSSYAQD